MCFLAYAECGLERRGQQRQRLLSDWNSWRTTGDMITQTAVGCLLFLLAKQSLCY